MNRCLSNKLQFLVIVGLCIGSVGCQQGYNLTKPAIDSDFIRSPQNQKNTKSLPIVVGSISSDVIFTNFSDKLNQTGLYSNIYKIPPTGNYIYTRLVIEKVPVSVTSILLIFPEAFLYGGSLSLLGPVLPIKSNFDYKYTLNVTWPNSKNKIYSAECAANASINFPTFGDNSHTSRQKFMYKEAEGVASNSCLNSLVNQMSNDYGLMTKGYGDDIKPVFQPVIDSQSPTSRILTSQPSPQKIFKHRANQEPNNKQESWNNVFVIIYKFLISSGSNRYFYKTE